MSNFQITIIPAQDTGEGSQTEKERFGVRQQGRGAGKIIEGIEDLGGVWDQVIQKLTALASQSQTATAPSQYELSSIEFNIGIEAGLSIGLVTKADASVAIVFKKKDAGGSTPPA
ncbi:MAG TPA: hypothetical protein VK749_17375 [Xanthobacteraceae bacterium]|jgi:hypothetical protein|nr:hypothetical protein [Xanthobacteraceae bacterium]